MQDLKDLKRCFHVNDRGGQAPALRAKEVFLSIPRATGQEACPSPGFPQKNRKRRM